MLLFLQDSIDISEVILIGLEAGAEKLQTVLEENMVVIAIKNRVVDIANKVLEEASDHYVNNLANF